MHNRRIRGMVLGLVLVLVSTSAFSQSLEDIVSKALAESSQMQNLEITKNNALLSKGISEAEKEVAITVTSGEVSATYEPSANAYLFKTSGIGASFVLPDDEETTISVSTGTMQYTTSSSAFAISPVVSASHTITYGYTTDNRESLSNLQTEVLATSTYEKSKLSFTNDLYGKIISLLSNEKSIKETEKEIRDLTRDLEQDLALKLLKEGSLTYEAQKQAIAAQEATLANLKSSRQLFLKQYASMTGSPWEGVDAIPEPDLAFTNNSGENSNIKLKSLDLSLAKEDLALKMAEFENKSLSLSGSLGSSSIDAAYPASGSSSSSTLSPAFSATLKGNNQFSVMGKVSGTYDFDANEFTPTVSVSGSWSNNPTSKTDSLTVQQLQNEVLKAEIAYTTAKDEYQQSATGLENSIASWNLKYTLLKQTMDYHKQVLSQQEDLLSRGLASQREVDEAAFTLEMDAYDLATTLLEGLQVENEIRTLHI